MAVLCGTLTGFASALRDAGAAAPAIQRILPCEHTVCHMPILLHCPQSLVKSDQLNPAALRDAGDDSDVSQFDVVVIDEASQVLPPTKFTTHLHFLHNNHIYYTCIYYIATTCIYYIATTPGDGARRPPDAPAPPRPPQRVGAEQNDPCWRPPPAPAYGCCPAHKKQPSPKTLQ